MRDEDVAAAHTPLFPYGDGSGFRMRVSVVADDGALNVRVKDLNDTVSFDASEWPTIRDEIDRLVAFMLRKRPSEAEGSQ